MKNLIRGIVLAIALASSTGAQDTNVEIAKRSRAIPKSCELVTPATLEPTIDVPALIKEAICKGAGDMLGEYTYTVNYLKRQKDKKGKIKDETFVYEVFIPTLKAGTRTKGVLVVTSHNGVPVSPEDLQKSRVRAAERIEKEEERIERNTPAATATPEADPVTGMLPLGIYTRNSITRSAFGVKSGGVLVAVADFLRAADLVLARREQTAGRETLIFNFTFRPDIVLTDNEKYMAQLTGEIWIDVADRIVTRLTGWPTDAPATAERPPAVYVEMLRIPQTGNWLPHVVRINGADYQKLFDGITTDTTSTYSDYIRFSTEVKDAKVKPPRSQ